MEQNEVIRRIREYHIIKDIIGSDSVKRLIAKKDAKVSEVLAVYGAYADFFGAIRIDQFEDFDRYFRRLENNYLADGKHRKAQPNEAGYDIYVKSVLGSKGLKTATAILSDKDIEERIKGLSLDVGKHTRESNAIVVARAIGDYSVVSGLKGNLSESTRKNDDLKADLERVRLVLKVTQRESLTKEAAIAKLEEVEAAIARVIVENSADSEYLMKAIAKSTGRKINELRDEVRGASAASRKRDEKILSEINGFRSETSDKLDKIDKKLNNKSIWKYLGVGAASAVGGLMLGLLLNGQEAAPIENPNDSADALSVKSAYVEYMDDVNSLGISFQNMISDGELDSNDAATFDAKVKTFLEKYDGTDFDGRSDADAELIKSLYNSFSTMSEEKKTAVYNYAVLLNDYNIVSANLEEYKVKNESLLGANADLQKKYDDLQAKVASLEAKIDELKDLLTSTDDAAKIQELLIKIQGLENQVADLNAQVNDLTGQNNILQGQVDSLTTENANLKSQVEALNKENEELKSDLNEANGLLATAQGQVETLTKEKAELQAKYDAGVLTEKQLREEIARLEKSEAELGKQVAELTSTIADLNEQLDAKVAEYNELLAKYNSLNSKNAELETELAEAQKTIADLQSQIENTTTESAELILDIYEYITGETTTDLAHAMQVLAEQLGLTTVAPSTPDVENNVKQPE